MWGKCRKGGSGSGGGGGGGQGGCEPRIELIVKMQKSRGGGGHGEPRIEVIVKMKKKSGGGVRWGCIRVVVNEELKLL